jgi:hypothetical protein
MEGDHHRGRLPKVHSLRHDQTVLARRFLDLYGLRSEVSVYRLSGEPGERQNEQSLARKHHGNISGA